MDLAKPKSGAPDFITIKTSKSFMLHKTQVAIHFRAKKPSPQTTRNFTLVCLWCCRRSVYGHMIAKFSRTGSLPHFLTHGALLRALRARELREKDAETNLAGMPLILAAIAHILLLLITYSKPPPLLTDLITHSIMKLFLFLVSR